MNRRGFTMLEALVALVLLSIVITGLVPMFKGAKSSQVGSYAVEQGSQFAESRIDSLRSLGRGALVLRQTLGSWTNPEVAFPMGVTTGSWAWKIDTPLVAGKAGTITVRISWKQAGTTHQIQLEGALP